MMSLTLTNKRFWTNFFALLAVAIAIGLLVLRNMENNQARQISSLSGQANKISDKISDKIKDK